MKNNPLRSARRFVAAATLALVATTLVGGCGSNGGVGDGVTDDGTSMPPGGSSSVAGRSGSVAGGPSSVSGSSGDVGGSAGLTGMSGSGGSAGTTVAGSGGSAGSAGNAGSAGKSAGGSSGTTGSAGSTTTGGSAGSPSGGAGAGGSSGGAPSGGTAGVAGATSGAGGSGGAGTGATCGDGALQGGEVCDDGPAYIVAGSGGGGGTSAGSGGSSAGSGGSSAGSGGGGMINPNHGATCSSDCSYKVSTQACVDCESVDGTGTCAPLILNCITPAPPATVTFTPAQSAACFSVMHCIQASNCLDGTGSLGKCYCGTLTTAQCGAAPYSLTAAGAPNGACAALIQAGLPGFTTNSAILGGLTNNSKPAGAAMQRLNCQKIADNAACSDVCGFTAGGPAFP